MVLQHWDYLLNWGYIVQVVWSKGRYRASRMSESALSLRSQKIQLAEYRRDPSLHLSMTYKTLAHDMSRLL